MKITLLALAFLVGLATVAAAAWQSEAWAGSSGINKRTNTSTVNPNNAKDNAVTGADKQTVGGVAQQQKDKVYEKRKVRAVQEAYDQ